MKRFIFWILVIFAGAESSAQNQPSTLNLPEIIPPEAAEIMKFIDHPVDITHGLMNVEIPLYVIQEGDIELPIVECIFAI